MRRVALIGFALGLVTSAALGQTQAPVGGALSGVVRDATGAPLADVTVSLLGESFTVRTDSVGRFSLRDVPPGSHTALFRRIGYRSVEYRWTSRAGAELQIAVAMTRLPQQIERVVVEAPGSTRRRGTSSVGGTVTDSAGNAVGGADVRLLAAGLSTVTDSAGAFEFQLLAAGSYIVRVRRQGLSPASYVTQIIDDDHRGITLKMFGLPRKLNPRDTATASGYGIPDAGFDSFDRRERGAHGNPVVGPGDLFRANRAPLDFVLQQYRDAASLRRPRTSTFDVGAGSTEDGDCILIDGRRAVYQPLRSFGSAEVQLVEVFRPTDFADAFLVSQMEGLRECRGSMERHPSYFVLWTRSLR